MLKAGDRIKVIEPTSYNGLTGTVLEIRPGWVPDVIVWLDNTEQIPELGMRFFWTQTLEKIKE